MPIMSSNMLLHSGRDASAKQGSSIEPSLGSSLSLRAVTVVIRTANAVLIVLMFFLFFKCRLNFGITELLLYHF